MTFQTSVYAASATMAFTWGGRSSRSAAATTVAPPIEWPWSTTAMSSPSEATSAWTHETTSKRSRQPMAIQRPSLLPWARCSTNSRL